MKKMKIIMATIITLLLMLATFVTAKWLKVYTDYKKLSQINTKYLSLKEEIKKYEIAIEEYKLSNGEKIDNEKKINDLNNKIEKLNKEIDDYNSDITRLNKELGIK